MFWTSLDSLRPLLDLHFMPEDFEPEAGQENNTTAHAIERLFGIVNQLSGGRFYQSNTRNVKPVIPAKSIHDYKFTRK
jgi:lipopolysaccharide biosynthesis protein